jgi:antitoxin HicB
MHEFIYPAKIEKDEDGAYLVTFRDLPFGAADGETIEEARAEARDCLEEVVAACIDDKKELPEPSAPEPGEYMVRLPAQTAAKAALYKAVKEQGISNVELARRMDVNEKEVRRMLDPRHPTKLYRIEKALNALGYHISVSFEAA